MVEFDKQKLKEARIQLHYALQVPASASVFIQPVEDYSHTSFQFSPGNRWLVGNILQNSNGAVAIKPSNLEVMILEKNDVMARFSLKNNKLSDGFSWLQKTLTEYGIDGKSLELPTYPDFPESGLKNDECFKGNCSEELNLLEELYARAESILTPLAESNPNASTLRVWPHHFDMASLISFSGEHHLEGSSIGMGFSPGDTSYHEPYFYVTSWPYPGKEKLSSLSPEASWHTEGWVGAILLVSNMKNKAKADSFFEQACIAAEKTLQK